MTTPRRPDSRAWRLPESEQRMPAAVTRARRRAVGFMHRERSGPLRYLVLGGAALGSFVGLLAGKVVGSGEADPSFVIIYICLPIGFVAGLTVGWVTFGFVASRADPSGTRRMTRMVTLLLALPAYLVAGGVSAAASGLAAGSAADGIAASALPITIALLIGYLVIAPLSFAFARGDRSQPTTFAGAVHESRVAMDNPKNPSCRFWAGVFMALWLLGSMFVVSLLLMGVDALAPGRGAEVGLWVVLAAWALVWLGGSAAVFWLAGRGSARDH
jgi:hypothetical protein